jgi:hypothetical protein
VVLIIDAFAEYGRKRSWEQLSLHPAAKWGKRASVGLALLGESFEKMALHLFLSHIIATPLEV